MAAYKLIGVHKPRLKITIREYSNGESRYFKAVIMGWNNFKFTSDTLKPQQLLDATLIKCIELAEGIKNDEKFISTQPSNFIFN